MRPNERRDRAALVLVSAAKLFLHEAELPRLATQHEPFRAVGRLRLVTDGITGAELIPRTRPLITCSPFGPGWDVRGQPVLIVDFGTAVTIDLVTADNTFRGGCISPGMKTRFRALHDYTACLPLCGPTESGELQGLTTEEAIRLGVMNSLTFEIEGYMARMEKKIDDLCVIFTGGDAKYFAKRIKNTIFANCNLVFCGLDRILEYNASEEHLD